MRLQLRRWTAATTALALLLGSTGCASPFHFSSRLDTRLSGEPGLAPAATEPLAGDLHLSLAAMMGQRRELWQAAGETEKMKNATALGLIGLSAAALYRGVRYTDNKGWLQRAGLLGAATYAGATWLEPSARQTIYLQGAMSLTCLALATAPYEMTKTEYASTKEHIAQARHGLEMLASELRLVGRYTKKSETWWVVRGGWNKLRWASRVLDSADVAMGNIEQAGPNLRDMTALLASEVATQVNRVSKNLSELQDAIAMLKPNVAKLVGADVLTPLKKDALDQDPPSGSTAPGIDPNADSGAEKAAGESAATPKDPQCSESAAPAPAATQQPAKPDSSADPKDNTSAESAAVKHVVQKVMIALGVKQVKESKPAAPAAPAIGAAEAAKKELEAKRRRDATDRANQEDVERANELRRRLMTAAKLIDAHLGPVASFVQRVASARNGLELPRVCGAAVAVKLVPDRRELVLQSGESFQFVLEGDSGKAAASYTGLSLSTDILDISMPLVQATSAVRFTAGSAAKKSVTTTIRISDSRREQNFDITVKVCPSPTP